ncbi:HAD family hydrolase [uncultured Bartonella sp.]|uniref:HAD family hydrolase n=1 Tax=uncultured Bartonella sp. TaxID=104108 RepID=UPI00263212B7|nr:HAD family hydrolase [uncultured Bartonella sp.]
MPQIDLVIFDCDGVLVDSEYLAAQIESQLLSEAGFEISAEELSERYAGLIFLDALKEIEKQSDIPLSASLVDRVPELFRKRMENELFIIDGARQAVKAVAKLYRYCICSNSREEDIKHMLTIVGLYDLFENRIFSAPEVGTKKVKPAPDVYLYAAKKMNARPENTIVIEDSVHGVHGAVKAGMRVIGFTGGSHAYPGLADALMEAGAETVISNHADLPAVLKALCQWQDI